MLQLCDGFDHYTVDNTLVQLTRKNTFANIGTTFSAAFSTVTGRYGTGTGKAFHQTGSNAAVLGRGFPNLTTIIFGFAMNFTTAVGTAQVLIFSDNAQNQCDLRTVSGGAVQLTRNGTVLATSASGLIAANTWNYFEVKLTVNSTTGLFECRLNANPTPIVTFTGNTQVSTNATVNAFTFIFTATGSSSIDDLYLCDTTGSFNNNYLGNARVITFFGTGAGTHTQWTPLSGSNWQEVSDNPPDDDTSYVFSTTPGQIDSYIHAALPISGGTILAAVVNSQARKTDAALRQIAGACRSAGTDGFGATQTLASQYMNYQGIFEADPATGAAWFLPALNAAEFGHKEVA